MQTMMLATSVGTTMGLTKSQLTDLGIGCLLHDSGMMMIDRRSWDKRGKTTGYDRLEISKHPGLAFDRVNQIAKVPNGSRMIVFQMHERMDGSGYPRQRKGIQIFPLSRIAMVADVFVALVSPRPHRPGLMPYQAMERIIKQAKDGLLDPKVVRGLLKTVSLFPITSFVVMSDGRVGKVIRSTGDTYTRPIVDLWQPSAVTHFANPAAADLTLLRSKRRWPASRLYLFLFLIDIPILQ
jgi:HD-GYP domain-containing protein (c-di-GMP phosphodiesterase class II)